MLTPVKRNDTGIVNHFGDNDHGIGRLLNQRIALIARGELRGAEGDTAFLQSAILGTSCRPAHRRECSSPSGLAFRRHGGKLSIRRVCDERSSVLPLAGYGPFGAVVAGAGVELIGGFFVRT